LLFSALKRLSQFTVGNAQDTLTALKDVPDTPFAAGALSADGKFLVALSSRDYQTIYVI
jgi:hypothetical protein